ncbi:MAG: glycosyltransferase family 2 protein [Coraliomargaritaceae bacterium]
MNTPLLLIHFNRPDITQRALAALKPLAPSQVWILCDAPRSDRPEEAIKVAAVRAQLEALPWPCEVRRLYREDNLGCFRNISDGISWFLKDCGGEGIILEDDCIADPSFFPFCTELLGRYRDDPSVYAISGHNRSTQPLDSEVDYLFLNYFECWGWATWESAWEQFDPDLTAWKDRRQWKAICRRVFPGLRQRLYWEMMFRKVRNGQRDSWAYRYFLSILGNNGKTIIPSLNLTENIGFREDGTHCISSSVKCVAANAVSFPLTHPESTTISLETDRWFEDNFHSKSFFKRIQWLFSKLRK